MTCRAIVDPTLCIGTSQCVATAPRAYRMNADGSLAEPIDGATREALQAGADACPMGAIRVVDEAAQRPGTGGPR